MKINYKRLLICIIIPLFLGSFVGFLTAPFNNYHDLKQPFFAPSAIVFPIVWSILYILMGISSYLIAGSNSSNKNDALLVYGIQLIINLIWSIIFFVFRWYFISFLWIILLIVFVVSMIKKFKSISPLSSYLQIPYLLWLIFAGILNLSVYFLNR